MSLASGDSGDNFYIVSSGHLECYVAFTKNSAPKLVKKYGLGESFGELALMYNCPRAASIIVRLTRFVGDSDGFCFQAKSDVLLWAMDRFTFRSVLMDTTSSKRKRYEGLLSSVEILCKLFVSFPPLAHLHGDVVCQLVWTSTSVPALQMPSTSASITPASLSFARESAAKTFSSLKRSGSELR